MGQPAIKIVMSKRRVQRINIALQIGTANKGEKKLLPEGSMGLNQRSGGSAHQPKSKTGGTAYYLNEGKLD